MENKNELRIQISSDEHHKYVIAEVTESEGDVLMDVCYNDDNNKYEILFSPKSSGTTVNIDELIRLLDKVKSEIQKDMIQNS